MALARSAGRGLSGANSLKVFNYEKAKQQAVQDSPGKGLTTFIGLCGSAALAVVMVLAVGHHLLHRDPVSKVIPAVVLLCITAFVAWERFEPNRVYGWHNDLPPARRALRSTFMRHGPATKDMDHITLTAEPLRTRTAHVGRAEMFGDRVYQSDLAPDSVGQSE